MMSNISHTCDSVPIGFRETKENRGSAAASDTVATFASEFFLANTPINNPAHSQIYQSQVVLFRSPGAFIVMPSEHPYLSCLVIMNCEFQLEHILFDIDEDGKFNPWVGADPSLRRNETRYENIHHFVRSHVPRYLPHSDNKTEQLLAQCEWNITFTEVDLTLQNAIPGMACLTPGENERGYILHFMEEDSVIRRKELFIHDESIWVTIDGDLYEADSLPELLFHKMNVHSLVFDRNENKVPENLKMVQFYYQTAFPHMYASGEKWFKLSRDSFNLCCSFYVTRDWGFYLHKHKNFFPDGGFIGEGTYKSLWEVAPLDPTEREYVRAPFFPERFSSSATLSQTVDRLKALFKELRSDLTDTGKAPILIPEIFSYERRIDNSRVYVQMMPKMMGDLIKERHNLDHKRKLHVALDIAKALDYMHKKGVVHRDVKPDNVLIETLDPVKSWLCDLDFIEKYTGDERVPSRGTYLYADPNVIRGMAFGLEDAIAADQFAWAHLLYVLIFDLQIARNKKSVKKGCAVGEECLTTHVDFYSIHPKLQKILLTLLLRLEPTDGSERLVMHEERPVRMDGIIEELREVIEELP